MLNFRHFCLPALLMLAACTGTEVQETLGLDRTAPDEFVVYSRPALSVPPDFDLKPPRPGDEGPVSQSTEAQAREVLLGTKQKPATLDEAVKDVDTSVETAVTPVLTSDAPTGAQSTFLKKAGADEANPEIRDQLNKDAIVEPKEQKKAQSLYERIVGDDKDEPVVEPKGEAERIRSNRNEDKPVTEGETPTKDTKPKSVIDKIF